MHIPDRDSVTAREAQVCRWAALSLLLFAAVARILYLANNCPLDLAPDEAHYWDWSRHLDWSYYSKGPLVAWIIRGSCELFGSWSVSLVGSEMVAVRLPAVICGSLLLLSLYVLTAQVFRNERLAAGVVVVGLTVPILAAGSTLMTIDSPYTCCWGWALVLAHRAIFRGSAWAWPAAGLSVALGILAKYNMLLFVPAVGMFLLTSREHRALLWQRGFWKMSAVAALGCLPILIWNVQNGWLTFLHVLHQSGDKKTFQWLGPVFYIGGQMAILLVVWFIVWAAAMVRHRPWREPDAEKRYLWWMSFPMFGVFLAFSFKTGGGELNWPVAAYLSGSVLGAGWLRDQFCLTNTLRRRLAMANAGIAIVLGLLLILVSHRSDLIRPVLLSLSGPERTERPFPLRRFDPSSRLRGWRMLAQEIDKLCAELRAQGTEPVLAATSWALPGEMAFYCKDHPTVFNVGQFQGDRYNQYDLWKPNPVSDPQQFRGRTFVVLNMYHPALLAGFDHVEQPRTITYYEEGHPLCEWSLTVARDFQGFPEAKLAGARNH